MSATTTQTIDAGTATEPNVGVSPTPPKTHQTADLALRADNEGEIFQYLTLGCLRIDERNVRSEPPTDDEVKELADLIESQGLLQNLTVVEYETPIKGKGAHKGRLFTHGVIAGGCRLRSLQLLVKRKVTTWDDEVLCKTVPVARALAISVAENAGRKPLSIADTVIAFADMVKRGAGIEDLAVCFGITPVTVKRRLKLASVSPRLFRMFREGEVNMDQLMVLALVDDHARQESVWDNASEWERSASALRRAITGKGVSPNVLKFVGVQAYEGAGGEVLRDLFAADDSVHPSHIQNPELMERLALERLLAHAEELKASGFAWVEAMLGYGYEQQQHFKKAPTTTRSATDEEAAAEAQTDNELTAINAKLEDLEEAYYDSDEQSDDEEQKIAELEAASEAASTKLEALRAEREIIADDVRALSGAVVHLDANGELIVQRNLLKREDAKAAEKANAAAKRKNGLATDELTAAPTSGLSESLYRQLTSHRTRALQAALIADHPTVALAALAQPLVLRLIYSDVAASYHSPSASSVRGESCDGQLTTWAPDMDGSAADQIVQQTLLAWRAKLPAKSSDLVAWLLGQPAETLHELLAVCGALSLNAICSGDGAHPADALVRASSLDMADWWQASGASYLARVSKSQIADALTDAGLVDEVPAVMKLKKVEAVAKAEELLSGKRWLPNALR